MFIGIDVGGTHTDAVIAAPGAVLKTAKTATRKDDMAGCVAQALALLLDGENAGLIRRVCVSTTLGLNALLTGKNDPAGVLVVPGPGMNSLDFWREDALFARLEGAQDHRGVVTASLDENKASDALARVRDRGARAVAVVAKFSPRNPELEEKLAAMAADAFPPGTPVIKGSSVSGSLNFPRRIHTAWCRASLMRAGRDFIASLEEAMLRLGLFCPLTILKADAGAFSADQAAEDPGAGMGSGPSAGMLGIMACSDVSETTLMLDIGGTTTDIALLVRGEPLLARTGLTVAGRPTLIRALWSSSIAVGGDSALRFEKSRPVTGPQRLGPALCFASSAGSSPGVPTLTDALNVLGRTRIGDVKASLQGLERLAASAESTERNPAVLARRFLDDALDRVRQASDRFLAEVNEKPVYTIRELLVDSAVVPERLAVIGTPAKALAPLFEERFGISAHVPEHFAFANAIGAALALPTRMAELYADTELGMMRIPSLGIARRITPRYTLEDASNDLKKALNETWEAHDKTGAPCKAEEPRIGNEAQITFGESFSMLTESGRRGKIIRAGAQLPAGVMRSAAKERPLPEKGNAL